MHALPSPRVFGARSRTPVQGIISIRVTDIWIQPIFGRTSYPHFLTPHALYWVDATDRALDSKHIPHRSVLHVHRIIYVHSTLSSLLDTAIILPSPHHFPPFDIHVVADMPVIPASARATRSLGPKSVEYVKIVDRCRVEWPLSQVSCLSSSCPLIN